MDAASAFVAVASLDELGRVEQGAIVRRLDAAQLFTADGLDVAAQPSERPEHVARVVPRERSRAP